MHHNQPLIDEAMLLPLSYSDVYKLWRCEHLLKRTKTMAGYTKYDARLESLVIETRTDWAADVADLSVEEKQVVARAIHESPELASKIEYERSHTGFTRAITVTADDIARLYQQKVSE